MKVMFALLVALVLPLSLSAQSDAEKYPSETHGLGIFFAPETYGISYSYAFTSNMHGGINLGAEYRGANDKDGTQAFKGGLAYHFEPFFKYYLDNIKNLRPYVMASAAIKGTPVSVNTGTGAAATTQTINQTLLTIRMGGEWFPYKSVAVGAGLNCIQYDADASQFFIGLGAPYVSLAWYF